MSDAPAGWYPDPTPTSAAPTLRYWDGATWTEHLAPATQYAAAPTGPTTPDGVPLASYGARVGAYLIDGALVGIISTIFSLPMQIRMNARMEELTRSLEGADPDFSAFWSGYADVMRDMMLWQLPLSLAAIAYFAGMLRWKGATVGKLAVGLRVRRYEEPGRLPWRAVGWRVAVQNMLFFVPVVLLFVGLWPLALVLFVAVAIFVIVDLLRPAWHVRRQAWHDAAAGTVVTKVR